MLAPDGRVIMVSGANRGIGRAVAEALYGAGYTLSLGARRPGSLAAVAAGWDLERVLADRYDAQDQASFNNQLKAKRKQVEGEYVLGKPVEFDAPVRSTVVVANGTFYVMTEKAVYAFGKK